MYKLTLGHRQLDYPLMRPELVRAVRRWGYEPLESGPIRSRLEDTGRKDPASVMCAAGIALIADRGRGLWPSRAFADALIGFSSERAFPCSSITPKEERIAMALSMPGRYDEAVSEAALAEHFTANPRDEDHRKKFTFVSSYLHAPERGTACPEPFNFIYTVLRVEFANYTNRGIHGKKPLESLCTEGWERRLLAEKAHIGWKVMPVDAWRLNIELVRSKITESVQKAAHMIAILVSQGFETSAKFTMSNTKPPDSVGERLVLYIPTAALMPSLKAAGEAGLFRGEIREDADLEMARYANTGFLLPDYITLRTSGEGGISSVAQGLEAVNALEQLKIRHTVLSLNRHDRNGETLDLGGGDRVFLFPNGNGTR